MSGWLMTTLYVLCGGVIYIVACVLQELECRKSRKNMDFDTYLNMLVIVPIWPVLVGLGLMALVMSGIIVLCNLIADSILHKAKVAEAKASANDASVK